MIYKVTPANFFEYFQKETNARKLGEFAMSYHDVGYDKRAAEERDQTKITGTLKIPHSQQGDLECITVEIERKISKKIRQLERNPATMAVAKVAYEEKCKLGNMGKITITLDFGKWEVSNPMYDRRDPGTSPTEDVNPTIWYETFFRVSKGIATFVGDNFGIRHYNMTFLDENRFKKGLLEAVPRMPIQDAVEYILNYASRKARHVKEKQRIQAAKEKLSRREAVLERRT